MCPPFWPTRALAQIPTFDSAASHLSWAYHLSELKVGQAPTTDLDLTVLWVTHLLRPTRAAIFRQLHPDQHASLSFSVFLLTKPCNLHSAHTTWRPVVPAWTRGNAENGKGLSDVVAPVGAGPLVRPNLCALQSASSSHISYDIISSEFSKPRGCLAHHDTIGHSSLPGDSIAQLSPFADKHPGHCFV